MQKIIADTDFSDIILEEGNEKTICYRFGACVYEETFSGHRYIASGWNGAGYTLNVLDDLPTRLRPGEYVDTQAFSLEADGVTLDYNWKFAGFAKTEETRGDTRVLHGVVTLENELKPVTVRVHTVLDGTSVMARWLELVNTGDAPIPVGDIAVLSGGVEEGTNVWDGFFDPAYADHWYSVGFMDSANWGCEGQFRWQDLPNAGFSVAGKWGRERCRHPAFFLRNNIYGSMFFGQLAYSGGYEFRFDKNTDINRNGCDSRLSWRLSITGPKPQLVLMPGEAFETPAMHVGMVIGDPDDAVRQMVRHQRRSVFTHPAARGMMGVFAGGMGPERPMSVAASKHFIDTIAAVGGETFIVDAGWYCPLGTATREWAPRAGDWYPDEETTYPNGIAEVRDYAHEKGLLFGMWMEAERLGKASKAFAEHGNFLGKPFSTNGASELIDMSNPEAAAWVESEIARVIETYKPDLFRLDHNTHVNTWFARSERGGIPECTILRHYRAVYAMYDRLRRRFPDVVFENCASGGARTDIGMTANFSHTWVSDWNSAPRSIAVTNGMTMVLPPEMVDRLLSGMDCHTRASLDWQVRQAIFGKPTTNDYNFVGSGMNPAQIDFVRHTADIYKNFVRRKIGRDYIYHHTPEIKGTHPRGTCVLERAAEDGTQTMLGIFSLCESGEAEHVVRPRGITEEGEYRVTFDNTGATAIVGGFELVHRGVTVRIGGALQSELVLVEKI